MVFFQGGGGFRSVFGRCPGDAKGPLPVPPPERTSPGILMVGKTMGKTEKPYETVVVKSGGRFPHGVYHHGWNMPEWFPWRFEISVAGIYWDPTIIWWSKQLRSTATDLTIPPWWFKQPRGQTILISSAPRFVVHTMINPMIYSVS